MDACSGYLLGRLVLHTFVDWRVSELEPGCQVCHVATLPRPDELTGHVHGGRNSDKRQTEQRQVTNTIPLSGWALLNPTKTWTILRIQAL